MLSQISKQAWKTQKLPKEQSQVPKQKFGYPLLEQFFHNEFQSSKKPTKSIIERKKQLFVDQVMILPMEYVDQVMILPMEYQGSLQSLDRRRKVKQMTYPYTAIGKIEGSFDCIKCNEYGSATGSLIHDNIVLTCAHIVFNKQKKCFANRLLFYPGLNGNQNKGIQACLAFVPHQYISIQNVHQYKMFDFAILILSTQPLADQYGYFAVSDQNIIQAQQIEIFGYPVIDKYANIMYGCEGHIIGLDSKKIYHFIQTSPGQSGAPVLRRNKQNYQIIGIHVSSGSSEKHAIRLTCQILLKINTWFNNIDLQNSQRHTLHPEQFLNFQIIKDNRFVPHKSVQGMQQAIDLKYDKLFNELDDHNLLFQIGRHLLQNSAGDANKAVRYLLKALEKCEKIRDTETEKYIQIILQLSIAQLYRGNLNDAFQYYSIAYYYAKEANSMQKETISLNGIAIIKQNRGESQQALEIYSKRIKLIKKKGIQNMLNYTILMTNQIQILVKVGRLKEASQNCDALQKLLMVKDQKYKEMKTYLKLCRGLIYLRRNQISVAKKLLDQCQVQYQKYKIQDCNSSILKNYLGQLEIQRGNIKQAVQYFKKALDIIHKKYGNKSFHCTYVLANLGYAEYRRDKNKAISYLQESRQIYQRVLTKNNRNPDYLLLIQTLQNSF